MGVVQCTVLLFGYERPKLESKARVGGTLGCTDNVNPETGQEMFKNDLS
jgi:hypothetical protein